MRPAAARRPAPGLTSLRTQAVCRLHALLAALTPGGVQTRISADAAATRLRAIHPHNAVEAQRKQMALELAADVRRLDQAIAQVKQRTTAAVTASGTTVTDIHGAGPIVAALLIGHAGDITRFPSSGHYASYHGTAPIEASSGPTVRHRLNPPAGPLRGEHALLIGFEYPDGRTATSLRWGFPPPFDAVDEPQLLPSGGRGRGDQTFDAGYFLSPLTHGRGSDRGVCLAQPRDPRDPGRDSREADQRRGQPHHRAVALGGLA